MAFKENEMTVQLMWATQNADFMVAKMARVSNPDNQDNTEFKRLLNYLMKHNHVSPFEMASMCVQIDTTRDISRQILRHRSFSFQEFSGRYEDMTKLGDMVERECRLQDTDNRQSSLECDDSDLSSWWNVAQNSTYEYAINTYNNALKHGIAKEQARALLPEGLTPTRLYMQGTIRSWVHYMQVRGGEDTQKEHRNIAIQARNMLKQVAPITHDAFFG